MSSKDARKLAGSWRARVERTDHPLGLYKVQVRVLGLWDAAPLETLPWAEYRLPLGTRVNNGGAVPSEVGDLVWVEFEQGDTRCPIITGGCLYAPDRVLNMPHEAFAGGQAYSHKRTDKQPKPGAAGYHRDTVFSLNGVLIEIEKSGAFRLTNKASGSAVELNNAGQFVLHAAGESFESSGGAKLQEVGGALTVIIKGDAKLETDGSYSVKAGGGINFEAGGAYSFKGTGASWSLG